MVKKLKARWFLMRDAHAKDGTLLLQPRWAMSFLRGPMTHSEIRRACELRRRAGALAMGAPTREAPRR